MTRDEQHGKTLCYGGARALPPPSVERWAKLYVNVDIEVGKLTFLNDRGHSFLEIADWIEENL